MDTRIKGYMDAGIQGYRDTRILGYKNTGIQGYRDTRILGCKDTRILCIFSIFYTFEIKCIYSKQRSLSMTEVTKSPSRSKVDLTRSPSRSKQDLQRSSPKRSLKAQPKKDEDIGRVNKIWK